MGGPGSGTWYRWDKKTTTEEIHSVDIRYMRRRGLLKSSHFGTLSWSRPNGERTGWIRYQALDDRLVLMYRYRKSGDEWQGVEESISFDWTPCNYGGNRCWFLCPRCSRRVAVLYGLGPRFLCRHCYRLPYASQQENSIDRLKRKARKIRESLGASNNLGDPVWEKPKGMHWRMFERLLQEEEAANEASTRAWVEKVQMLMGWTMPTDSG
jgi:hypothetical protein